MSKKTKLIAIIVAVSVLISALAVGGAVMAQTSTPTPSTPAASPASTLLSKVATILGIDQQTLQNAIKQAERELVDEAIAKKLADAVSKGIITPDQADKIKTWLAERPDINLPLGKLPRGIGRVLGDLRGLANHRSLADSALVGKVAGVLGIDAQKLTDAVKQAEKEIASEMLDKRLADAVAKGLITQDQANQIKAWLSQKPDFLAPGLLPGLERFPGAMGEAGKGGRHMPWGRGMFRQHGAFQMQPDAGSSTSPARQTSTFQKLIY